MSSIPNFHDDNNPMTNDHVMQGPSRIHISQDLRRAVNEIEIIPEVCLTLTFEISSST